MTFLISLSPYHGELMSVKDTAKACPSCPAVVATHSRLMPDLPGEMMLLGSSAFLMVRFSLRMVGP